MSARKALARMDSPTTTTESLDAMLSQAEGLTTTVIETVLKPLPTENGNKPDAESTGSDLKPLTQIKEEKKDPDRSSSTETLASDVKRQNRNSPMVFPSPLKKKSTDSDDKDSSTESPNTADDNTKKNEKPGAGRPRKQSDTNNKSVSSTVQKPTNRLTRKAAAEDLALKTRFTRARRSSVGIAARRPSGGIGARPETPPKRKYVFKKQIEPAVKRKRSVSPKPSAEEPESKINKSDINDGEFEAITTTVKQEILESSEEMASDVASDITEPFQPSSSEPTPRISLRARKAAMSYSPSTRPYRRDKDKEKLNAEPVTPDAKRKRLNRVRPDEDSKDSMTSSNMEDMVEIKVEEKSQSEEIGETLPPPPPTTTTTTTTPSTSLSSEPSTLCSIVANGSLDKVNITENAEESKNVEDTTKSTDKLTIDTAAIKPEIVEPSTSAIAESIQSNSSDKAASLSPDLVSEGVSEISVKRFYKKPEFLENNLGIENDPKLGEIVQNVAEKLDDAIDATSVSNESIKEGELVFEEEEEEEVASIGSIKHDNDDEDVNSVSTGFISPLLVEEDEDDDDAQSVGNGDEATLNADKLELVDEKNNEEDDLKMDIEATDDEKVTESCDKVVAGDIEDKKDKDLKLTADKVELKLADKMELEENVEQKGEDTIKMAKIDENNAMEIADQEENKENVEIKIKADSSNEDTPEVMKSPEKESTLPVSADEHEEPSSELSKNTSPQKNHGESSSEITTPSSSPQSSKSSPLPRATENDEKLRQKERHLKTLGLLTHKAADEAIIAKQKRRKFLHNLSNNGGGAKKNATTNAAVASTGSAAGNAQNKSSQEYTGTLKTVIKLNRPPGGGTGNGAAEPKKGKNVDVGTKVTTSGCSGRRQSLKMTFQKGRGRPANTEKPGEQPANTSSEDSYYTIQNEGEGGTTSTTATTGETASAVPVTTHGRKSYNRSNTTDTSHQAEKVETPATSKKDEKEEILIPEKASSFKFHPGRLCQDQCYYCSGKFGLYDTPCHVGQIKSVERQQKILSNEEKLTVDNCLCDACFRHVDRRANAPTYKKRLSAPGQVETATAAINSDDTPNDQEKTQHSQSNANGTSTTNVCAVPDCNGKTAHSLRRKCIRKNIKKSLLSFDMSSTGTYLHLCEDHYNAVVKSSGCVLCKRRLGKNNMYNITTVLKAKNTHQIRRFYPNIAYFQDTDRLEKALAAMGIPVTLGQVTAVCKLCRYFASLLLKPPEHGKMQKIEFVKNYRKRLLQFYNIHEKDTSNEEEEEGEGVKEKEKPASTKKQSAAPTSKGASRKSREEEPRESIQSPPSPAPSTGSSVEVISDGALSNAEESVKQTSETISTPTAQSNQMVLDNDVMVDYDVPTISESSSSASSESSSPSPKTIKHTKDQQSKLKAILQSVGTSLEDRNNISTVLRSNPNLSMRELFPGEEDLGLQFKAPFGGSSSQRTPEGWTRVNTFLQYDEPTRRLWEELQKPYGNQSSFLRHLILLEKYHRNGDLILSSNASSNATVYTQTLRNRLTSYDSRSSSCSSPSKEPECRTRSLSVDKIQRQLSSNSVTITARPKETKSQPPKEGESNKQTSSTTTSGGGGGTAAATSTPNSRSILKTNLITSKSGAIEIVPLSASNSPHSSSGSSTPNDNALLTKPQKILAAAKKLVNNKLEASPNNKKTSLNTTPPELISLNRRPVPASNAQPLKRPQLLPKPMNSSKPLDVNVVVLPDTLTAQERLESKSWRPTLLPVTTSSHNLNNQQGPLYQTADGRRLPALVQVQSSGKPFLISIHDYNRMCILRREKLIRDQVLRGNKGKGKLSICPPATCTPNPSGRTGAYNALQSLNKTMQVATSLDNATKKQRFLTAKNPYFTPIAPKPLPTSTATTSATSTSTSQQQHSQSKPTVILPAGTLQPIKLISSTQSSGLSILPNFSGHVMPVMNPSSSASTVSGISQNPWLWNNFPSNQMLMNGKSTSTKGPQATVTSAKPSLLLDNTLMSKIPKSLTVIPQHKLMPAPSRRLSVMDGNTSKD